jgi:hypothetical protein
MPVRWDGMDDYRELLTGWPLQAAIDARAQVERSADAAFSTIRSGYPVVTGRLKAGLQIRDVTDDAMHPRIELRNDVVYARVWESGGNSTAGVHKAGKLFVPTMQRQRKVLNRELIDIIKTGAETVTGDE